MSAAHTLSPSSLNSHTTPQPPSTSTSYPAQSLSHKIHRPFEDPIDLPPPHIISHLVEVYYRDVHPLFPVLGPKTSQTSVSPVEAVLGNGTGGDVEGNTALVLAMCAYTGRLSPSSASSLPAQPKSTPSNDAGKVAADLWYEQSRTLMMRRLRGKSSLEGVRTLLFCALRDQGRGREGQSWLLLGAYKSFLLSFALVGYVLMMMSG